MTASPLRRNRDFLLLQSGLLLSSAGSQMTAIAYPLLVLALTGSAAKAGAVAFVRFLAMAMLALPSGIAADRWNRRRLMIAAHAGRALAIGTLGVLVVTDEVVYWVIPLVAFVEGAGPRSSPPPSRVRSVQSCRRSSCPELWPSSPGGRLPSRS